MANRIYSSTDIYKQSQDDIFSDGKVNDSFANAGATVTASAAEGQKSPTSAVDGDLQTIDTDAESLSTDPTANTTGNADVGYSQSFLFRWIIKLLQGLVTRTPEFDATDANSATNAVATFTIAAPGAGNYIRLKNVYFGYDTAPASAGTLTISATGITSVVVPATAAGTIVMPVDLKAPVNTAVTVSLSAGGAAVVGYVAAVYN